MALIQHHNEQVRFQQQAENARAFVIPFIEEVVEITSALKILDIGCGDGGVLIPFLEKGCICTGIELDENKANFARDLLEQYITDGLV